MGEIISLIIGVGVVAAAVVFVVCCIGISAKNEKSKEKDGAVESASVDDEYLAPSDPVGMRRRRMIRTRSTWQSLQGS